MASFDRRGDRIVTGSSKGKMLIIDSASLSVLKTFKFSGNAVKSIEFARRGRYSVLEKGGRRVGGRGGKGEGGWEEEREGEREGGGRRRKGRGRRGREGREGRGEGGRREGGGGGKGEGGGERGRGKEEEREREGCDIQREGEKGWEGGEDNLRKPHIWKGGKERGRCKVSDYYTMYFRSNFLVNSADRVIRVFDIEYLMEAAQEEEIEPLQKLQDLVNRWVEPKPNYDTV